MSTIKLMCSNSTHGAMKVLLPRFEHTSGHSVDVTYDTAKLTLERVAKGEMADLTILNTPALDELKQQGKLDGDYRVLARCGVGVAVLAGASGVCISVSGFCLPARTLISVRPMLTTCPCRILQVLRDSCTPSTCTAPLATNTFPAPPLSARPVALSNESSPINSPRNSKTMVFCWEDCKCARRSRRAESGRGLAT